MLRALGFKKSYLVAMISMSSLSFSIPGLIFGMFVAVIMNIGIREQIFIYSQNYLGYDLSQSSLIIGIVFGLGMPFLANYMPIKSAMDKNLRTSLDQNKRTQDEYSIKIERLENVGMSLSQFIIALTFVAIGFMSFYWIPRSFQNQEMMWFFFQLNLVLVLIVVGLTFLSTLLFRRCEKIMLWLTLNLCCRRDKSLYLVIVKNMKAHRKRNMKTSIMFTMSISFLMFATTTFQLLIKAFSSIAEQMIGADMYADTQGMEMLNEGPITELLDKMAALESKPIVDYCFVSASISQVMAWSQSRYEQKISDINGFKTPVKTLTKIHAVPENFFNVTGT